MLPYTCISVSMYIIYIIVFNSAVSEMKTHVLSHLRINAFSILYDFID